MLKRIGVAFRRCRSSAAVAGYGAEGRALIFPFVAFLLGNSITQDIKTKNHLDAIAEVVNSEQINRRQAG
jgi:hypothetical protein